MTKQQWYSVTVGGENFYILAHWVATEGAWDPMQLELLRAEQLVDGHRIEVRMPVGAHDAVKAAALSLA